MKKLTAILLTVVMLFTCLSDTAIAVEYSSETAGSGYVEVVYIIPLYVAYGWLDNNYAIAITLPNNFGGPQDVTDSIRWEAYYAGSKFNLKSGDPYTVLEEPEFNPNAKGGYVDEQLILFGAFVHGYFDGSWATLPLQNQFGVATSICIKATFNIKGGIGNSHINNIDNYSYLQLVDAETYEPVIATAFYGTSWSATVREHHEGNFSPVTGTTHSGYCNLCGKTITEDCSFVGGYCEWCQQEERYAPVYWEPKDSELPNMSAANEAVLNVKLNKPIVGMAEYTLYAKASADVSDNWFSMSSERVFVDTVSVDGTASELSFRVPTEYIYSGCGFVAFENILLYDSDIMADYMHVDRAKVGNEAGSKGRLSWKAAGDDKLYFDGLPTNYTKLGVQHNYSLNMGADVEAIQYSLTADTSGTYYTLNPANGTVNFGTPTADKTQIGFEELTITFNKAILTNGTYYNSQKYAQLDFSKGTISLYKSNGERVWQAYQSTFDDRNTSIDIRVDTSKNACTLLIRPSNSHVMLEYDTSYYVVIDPGVVLFENGTAFEGISKGQWCFSSIDTPLPKTAPLNIKESFKYVSTFTESTVSYPFDYDESWFYKDSRSYNHDLAKMSLRMAMSAAWTTSDNIVDLFDRLGFSYTSESISYPKPTTDTIGYAIGGKKIVDKNGKEITLVVAAIRGGGYSKEWADNFRVGMSSTHAGFLNSALKVEAAIEDYIETIKPYENIRIWITGYSRAAAVANIVAAQMTGTSRSEYSNDLGLSEEGIYAYCFECPRVAQSDTP